MIAHTRFLELAAAQLDFVFTDDEADELQAHLAGCAVCSADVRGLRDDAKLMVGLPILQMRTARQAAILDRVGGGRAPVTPMRRVAIAALLALLALGLAVFGAEVLRRLSTERLITYVPPTAGPSASFAPPSTVPTAPPVDAELQDWWFGPHKDVPGIGPTGGTVLEIGPADAGIYSSDGREETGEKNNIPFVAGDAFTSGGILHVSGVIDDFRSCDAKSSGSYPYSITPSGQTLTVEPGTDDCTIRLASFPGTWWRADCPGRVDLSKPPQPFITCLGDLDAGAYESEYFSGLGSGLAFAVPEGWTNYLDSGSTFGLTDDPLPATIWPDGPFPDMSIDVLPDVQIKLADEVCKERGLSKTRQAMSEMPAVLGGIAGIVVTPPIAMTVDGYDATYVDIAFDSANAQQCARSSVNPRRWVDPSVDYLNFIDGGAINAHHRQRVILIDPRLQTTVADEPGVRPVVFAIRIDVATTLDFEAEVARAMAVIESFHFLKS